jgi:hypothetical protein
MPDFRYLMKNMGIERFRVRLSDAVTACETATIANAVAKAEAEATAKAAPAPRSGILGLSA